MAFGDLYALHLAKTRRARIIPARGNGGFLVGTFFEGCAAAAFVFTVVRGEKTVTVRGQTSGPLYSPPIRRGIYRGEKTADDLREESDNTRSETVVHAREICFDKY